jgi:RNA polymerase sigma-70 factor, ECF subfamily
MGRVMGDDPFESIVATHHGEIHRYLARVTTRASDADDLSQETFLRAFRAHRGLPAEANVRAWLFAIATNLYRNYVRGEVRRRKAMAAASTDGYAVAPGWPEGVAQLHETSARIDRIISELPLKQRVAFTMRKMHELEYEAIGEALTCSTESARAHVFQALKKIRRGLDDQNGMPTESAR